MNRFVTSLSLVLCLLVGCAQPRKHSAWSSRDDWYQPPAEWLHFREARKLPDAEVVEVAPDHLATAEQQLRDTACVEVSSQHASGLAGHQIESSTGSKLYLVRAVYLNRGTGKFSVIPVGRELLVEHGSLGHSAVPMKRSALIVYLSQMPEAVYVSCSMDE